MTITIITYVVAARAALEALAERLRRGADASLETTEACAALRALADAWARVLPRLPEDVTPPEWPIASWWNLYPCSPGELATRIADGAWRQLAADEPPSVAETLDAYADGLRAWGREAAACEEEIADGAGVGPSGPCTHPASARYEIETFPPIPMCRACGQRVTAVDPSAPRPAAVLALADAAMGAPSLATVHTSLIADEPDPDSAPYTLSALESAQQAKCPTCGEPGSELFGYCAAHWNAFPVAGCISGGPTVRADVAPCGHASHGVCSECSWGTP